MGAPSSISIVRDRGRVSIPAHLRKELGLEKGRRLLWEKVGHHEIRIVVLPDVQPKGARAMMGFARRFRPTRSTRDWMNELRQSER